MADAALREPLPERLWPGRGTALYLVGQARSRSPLKRLELAPATTDMQLETHVRANAAGIDDCCDGRHDRACLMSAFDALWRIGRHAPHATLPLSLVARFADGSHLQLASATIEISDQPAVTPTEIAFDPAASGPRVVICMATYEPEPRRLARQIESIRAQSHANWHCIINDDASSTEAWERYAGIIGDDPRFSLYRNAENQGFYHNFETALLRVPATVDYVALADQDDDWYPDKLAACLATFTPTTTLVYSDMRVVDESGGLISESYWRGRRNNHTDPCVLFLANTVTGAAAMFRRELLDDILPFPQPVGQVFHDHWIACVARCRGALGYVDRPLYDYYQYGSSVIGHCDFAARGVAERLRGAVASARHLPRIGRAKQWLVHKRNSALNVFHHEFLRLHLFREILLMRIPQMDADARRWLRMFGLGPGALWSLLSAHLHVVRKGDTTDDAELRLAGGLLAYRLDRLYSRLFAGRIVRRHCRRGATQKRG